MVKGYFVWTPKAGHASCFAGFRLPIRWPLEGGAAFPCTSRFCTPPKLLPRREVLLLPPRRIPWRILGQEEALLSDEERGRPRSVDGIVWVALTVCHQMCRVTPLMR